MRFRVHAAERETGKESTFEIEADTVSQARKKVTEAGYLVGQVTPLFVKGKPPIDVFDADASLRLPEKDRAIAKADKHQRRTLMQGIRHCFYLDGEPRDPRETVIIASVALGSMLLSCLLWMLFYPSGFAKDLRQFAIEVAAILEHLFHE